MAITFPRQAGVKYYTLEASAQHNWCGVTQASLFFFVKVDSAIPRGIPLGSGGEGPLFLGKQIFDYYLNFFPTVTDTVNVRSHLIGANGSGGTNTPLTIGSVYGFALTWDGVGRQQIVWVNGEATVVSSVAGPVNTSFAAMTLGLMLAGANVGFTVDKLSVWDEYILTAADKTALLNGADPTTIGTGAPWRAYYPLNGAIGQTPVHSDPGMTNAIDGTLNFVSESGTGTAIYSAPLVWSPTVTALPYVTGAGKNIAITFTLDSDGSVVTPTRVFSVPALTVNGVDKGPLTHQAFTIGTSECLFYSTPGAFVINPGDTVSLSAPSAWCNTPQGPVGALSGPISNRAGGSSFQLENLPKTLRIGAAASYTSALEYYPWLNGVHLVGRIGNLGKLDQGSYQITSTACEIGLFLLVWDATLPATPAQFSCVPFTPATVAIKHLTQYDQSPADGVGHVRVYDAQPVPGSAWDTTYGGFQVGLQYIDPGGPGHYENLWIYLPGEWSLVNGVPQFDRSDKYALSPRFVERMKGNSCVRATDTTPMLASCQSFPTPELLSSNHEYFWPVNGRYGPRIGFTSIGPVDVAATPWIYSAQFKLPGCAYTATLANPVTTAPAVGTMETWIFTDGATAPLMAQLEILVDAEMIRLISQGSDANHWTVYRGSNGTIPATHAAGPVTVYGRQPIRSVLNSVDSDGHGLIVGNMACTMTTSAPHGLLSQQLYQWQGPINITLASGQVVNGLTLGYQYTTGPNTFMSFSGGYPNPPQGAKPSRIYPLNSTAAFLQNFWYLGMPLEAYCDMVSRLGSDLWINLPLDGCDDLFYKYAWIVRDNFVAGRKIFLEWGNEPWNFGAPFKAFSYIGGMGHLCMPAGLNTFPLAYYAFQTSHAKQIFHEVFKAAGRDGELQAVINCQMGSGASQVLPELNLGFALGTPFDCVAMAPYYDLTDDATTRAAFAVYDDDQMCEMLAHDIWHTPANIVQAMIDNINHMQTYNAAHGQNCVAVTYEGGLAWATPQTAPYNGERNNDCNYNPGMYWTEQAFFALLQKLGFRTVNQAAFGQGWPYAYAYYHSRRQPHSRGDGLNGAVDNRHYKVDPRSPYLTAPGGYRPASTRQDNIVDSVRGQAILDWNAQVGISPPPPPPPPPPPVPSGMISVPWLGSWFGRWFAGSPPRIGRPVNLRARTRKATR